MVDARHPDEDSDLTRAGEVMLAAAHNRNLTFARQAGLGTAFIPRPTELGQVRRRTWRPTAIGTSSVRASSTSAAGSPMPETAAFWRPMRGSAHLNREETIDELETATELGPRPRR